MMESYRRRKRASPVSSPASPDALPESAPAKAPAAGRKLAKREMLRRKSQMSELLNKVTPAELVRLLLEARATRRKGGAVGSRGAPSVLLTNGAVRNERLRRYIIRLSAQVQASDKAADQLARDVATANARIARLQREVKKSSADAEYMLLALQALTPDSPRAPPLTPPSAKKKRAPRARRMSGGVEAAVASAMKTHAERHGHIPTSPLNSPTAPWCPSPIGSPVGKHPLLSPLPPPPSGPPYVYDAQVAIVASPGLLRMMTTKLLERCGVEAIVPVGSGAAIIELTERGDRFEVIIMDRQMTGVDGSAATRRIRELGVASDVTAIVGLSASASSFDEFREAGLDAVFMKPLQTDQWMLLAEKWLR